ncbi:hypothetical protein Sste5346_004748 [Sporothrix stenoceras]|uniref:Major facilitator superfamily (MFS) profile domain-containing protein n=1 Tax=Sporothrix stenoceras TaxID=5173 RepID=A0ABR3Z6R8_9PEZI
MADIYHSVPGTIHMVDTDGQLDHHGSADVILNPQPSADPEDPLNWSPRRKRWAILMAYTYVFGTAIATTVQYSVAGEINKDTGISIASIDTGNGLMFLFAGWGCLLWQPVALVYGRRGVYLLSSLLTTVAMIWTALGKTTGSWYGHRILIGLFVAPVESLPEVSVSDLFFAHERGTYIGIYALMVFGSNALAPFFAGFIAETMPWQAAIWFGAIVCGVCTIIIFFGLEETMYLRTTVEGADDNDESSKVEAATMGPDAVEAAPGTTEKTEKTAPASATSIRVASPIQAFAPPRSYAQKLNLFRRISGRPSVKDMFVMMYRPLLLLVSFPSIVWAGFLYGSNLSWYMVVNGTMVVILGSAPYNFSTGAIGAAYISVFVGAVVGAVWAGWAGDKLALYLARRNNGIREPEHRLWVLVASALIGAAGFLVWGVGAAHSVHFMGPVIGVAMVEVAVVTGASAALSYGVDCFKEMAGESLILIIVIRNSMGFGFSYGITPWLNAEGYTKTFIAVSMLSLGCTLTFLAMSVFGKSLRRMSAKRYWAYVETQVMRMSH